MSIKKEVHLIGGGSMAALRVAQLLSQMDDWPVIVVDNEMKPVSEPPVIPFVIKSYPVEDFDGPITVSTIQAPGQFKKLNQRQKRKRKKW